MARMGSRTLLELTRRYCEPHRHYHTLEHVAAMLHAGRELPLDDRQLLAVWFHDAVYDPRSDRNEEDSAALAGELLAADGLPPEDVAAVQAIVLDTEAHRPQAPGAAAVIDLDLASLALPWERYIESSRRIRAEYSHLSDADYRHGLTGFLTGFLARERIYWTPWGEPREAAARSNLERLLAETLAR